MVISVKIYCKRKGEAMPLANINGNEINYKDTGGDKPAIIFSHGFFMNLSSFDPQLEILKDKYRCISWDERGFGGLLQKKILLIGIRLKILFLY